ncbi:MULTISPECIES: DHH family phosphoesterase [Stomatobaculum]|uniref:DHH family phosphoesterase n=1 Tax=Stomatobaculum TaxID=1213720 RepID=UPI00272D7C5C|nr:MULTISPECIES: DHH family phosphoesterase [Stomatobaculum]WLD86411.1 DHH family phosphoesterase [Stomatobaculum sp. F0698]
MKEERKAQEKLRNYLRWPIFPAVLSILMAVLICVANWETGLLVFLLALICGGICLRLYAVSGAEINRAMIGFSAATDSMQARLAENLDLCYALLDRSGAFSYQNTAMTALLAAQHKNPRRLDELFPELNPEELAKITESADYHLSLGELRLRVRLVREKLGNDKVFALYFYDETALLKLREEEESRRLTAGLLYLDNYEEAMESVDDVRRPLLTAMIDRKIVRYFDGMQAIMKKLEKDKYFFVIERRYLMELYETQFDILEQVKTVNIGNEMRITLSIGIGDGGGTYAQCYDFARQAIDMALGRGGDQAVVKDGENIHYFGGKTNSKEKTTRVKARVKAHAFRELIENKDRLLIMGHKLMDIDSLGAAVGIWRIAATMGKEAHIVSSAVNNAIRPMLARFQNGDYPEDMFIPEEKALQLLDEGTVLVVVDTNRPSMVEGPRLLDAAKTIVVLDHHRQSQDSIRNAQLSYVETYASSACEMVAEVVQYISDEVKIRAVEADAMYAGIVIDTHNFQNQTGVRTFEAAAFLRRNGADVTRVRKLFREKLDDYRAKSEAIHNAEIYREHFALSFCDAEGLESPTVVGAQAANDLLDVIGVKASVVATTFREKVFLSARAIDEVNVQVMMEKLGGGGHRTIAGAQLANITQEEAMDQVKQVIDEMLLKGEI